METVTTICCIKQLIILRKLDNNGMYFRNIMNYTEVNMKNGEHMRSSGHSLWQILGNSIIKFLILLTRSSFWYMFSFWIALILGIRMLHQWSRICKMHSKRQSKEWRWWSSTQSQKRWLLVWGDILILCIMILLIESIISNLTRFKYSASSK